MAEVGKKKAIKTAQSIYDHVEGGFLCLTLADGDYVALGASIFVGLVKEPQGRTKLMISCPQELRIQRYIFDEGVELGGLACSELPRMDE